MKAPAAVACLGTILLFAPTGAQERTIQTAKTLVTQSDLYCSFSVLADAPRLKIVAVEAGSEKTLLADGDVFYVAGQAGETLREGETMTILEAGRRIRPAGAKAGGLLLAFKRGRAVIVRVDKDRALARVEKACGAVAIGNGLVPFVEKEGLLGHDLGIPGRPGEEGGAAGRVIYLDSDFAQIGPGQWALVDIGQDHGVRFGQQLGIYRRAEKGRPLEPIGNAVVIDAGRATATVKVLSSKDAVRIDDVVQVR